MDHHGIENGILFFFRPSSYSSLQRRKYSIFTVTTSLSPLDLQTRNPTKSCCMQILRNAGFLSTDSSTTLAGQAAHKQILDSVPMRFPVSSPLFLKPSGFNPFLLPQLLALNPKAAPPEQQGPAKPLPKHKRNVSVPLLRSAGTTDRKGKV